MLEELFVNKQMAEVLEHFILHEKWEQNQKELIEYLQIYPKPMKEILEKLLNLRIIYITKTIARTNFYRVNQESTLINPLRKLIQEFSFEKAKRVAEEQLNVDK